MTESQDQKQEYEGRQGKEGRDARQSDEPAHDAWAGPQKIKEDPPLGIRRFSRPSLTKADTNQASAQTMNGNRARSARTAIASLLDQG